MATVSQKKALLILVKNKLSEFLSTARIKKMIQERGQMIDAAALSDVLKRPRPTQEQIAASKMNL
jgi:hypothetical protein